MSIERVIAPIPQSSTWDGADAQAAWAWCRWTVPGMASVMETTLRAASSSMSRAVCAADGNKELDRRGGSRPGYASDAGLEYICRVSQRAYGSVWCIGLWHGEVKHSQVPVERVGHVEAGARGREGDAWLRFKSCQALESLRVTSARAAYEQPWSDGLINRYRNQ